MEIKRDKYLNDLTWFSYKRKQSGTVSFILSYIWIINKPNYCLNKKRVCILRMRGSRHALTIHIDLAIRCFFFVSNAFSRSWNVCEVCKWETRASQTHFSDNFGMKIHIFLIFRKNDWITPESSEKVCKAPLTFIRIILYNIRVKVGDGYEDQTDWTVDCGQ